MRRKTIRSRQPGLRVKPTTSQRSPAGQALSLTRPGTTVWANQLRALLLCTMYFHAPVCRLSWTADYCHLPPPASNYPVLLVGDVMRLFNAAAAAGFRVLPLSSTLICTLTHRVLLLCPVQTTK